MIISTNRTAELSDFKILMRNVTNWLNRDADGRIGRSCYPLSPL